MNRIIVEELGTEELIQLLYDIIQEMEARLKYGGHPIPLTDEEIARLPY